MFIYFMLCSRPGSDAVPILVGSLQWAIGSREYKLRLTALDLLDEIDEDGIPGRESLFGDEFEDLSRRAPSGST